MDDWLYVLEFVSGDWSVDIPQLAGVFETLLLAQSAAEETEPMLFWLPSNENPTVLHAKSRAGMWSYWRVYPVSLNVYYEPVEAAEGRHG